MTDDHRKPASIFDERRARVLIAYGLLGLLGFAVVTQRDVTILLTLIGALGAFAGVRVYESRKNGHG